MTVVVGIKCKDGMVVAGCPILAGLPYARVGLGFSASSSPLPNG